MRFEDVRSFRNACNCWVGLAWMMAASVALAHGEHGAEAHSAIEYLDCQNPPKNLVSVLPQPLAAWARIECAGGGQRIVAGEGKLWRYPASWFDRPLIPAWGPDESGSVPGAKYFIQLEVQSVAAADIAKLHGRLSKAVPAYADAFSELPQSMYRLSAENNLGHEMDVYFAVRAHDDLWAVMCTPDCRPEYAFMMQAQPK